MANQTPSDYAVFEDYRYSQRIAVVIRWFLLVTWIALLNYRTDWGLRTLAYLNGMGLALAGVNGYVHWRAWQGRPVTRPYVLALSALDLTIITVSIAMTTRFHNTFYVFYYPALLGLAVVYPSRGISFTAVTLVAAAYVTLSVALPPGVSYTIREEKALAVRVITMFAVVVAAQLVHRVERARRREAVAAERQRAQENLELERRARQAEQAAAEERNRIARDIHDGIAQSLYMLSISLEACSVVAARGQQGLEERLTSLSRLSKQALLDARHYIFDLRPLQEGRASLAQTLERQVQEFQTVTGLPAAVTVTGAETPLPLAASMGLHRIVQESLANVYKHAQASKVEVRLAFQQGEVQLQVRDDGQGFVPGGEHAGHGLHNLAERARELGGRLDIASAPGQGACVTLTLPAPVSAGPPE